MKEIWKDVVGYEKIYMVSNMGRVKNKNNKILKIRMTKKGYDKKLLYKNGKGKEHSVHRLVLMAFVSTDAQESVNHKDGNKLNNTPGNLEWCTHIENMKHAKENKLIKSKKGFEHYACKVTPEIAKEIKSKYIPRKYSMDKLSKEYNLGKKVIRSIVRLNRYN